MKEKKYEYVRSLRLAGYLMMNGFRILDIHHNLKIKGKDVYVFKQTETLQKCILDYISKRAKEE